jgi:hypothetical protein
LGAIAGHIGTRIASLAGASELVSGTVKDRVAGSEMHYEERGSHELKGIIDLEPSRRRTDFRSC